MKHKTQKKQCVMCFKLFPDYEFSKGEQICHKCKIELIKDTSEMESEAITKFQTLDERYS